MPDNPATGEIYVVDTIDLFAALEGDSSNNARSLDRVCGHLQIETKFLHNAGNDAYVSPLPHLVGVTARGQVTCLTVSL